MKEICSAEYRILKRLEELAFLEKSTAAVAACKAYLALSSFAKQRIEMEVDDLSNKSDEELDKEIRELQKKLHILPSIKDAS